MKAPLYVITQPGADRPYFSHTPPEETQKKPGAKVFEFLLDLPGFEADVQMGTIQPTTIDTHQCTRPNCGCDCAVCAPRMKELAGG